jgi:ribosomal protein S6--L-glutamate ligase
MKLVIFTSEPTNFVPEQLKAHGDSLGHEVQVVDVSKTALVEQASTADGSSNVFVLTDDSLVPLEPPFVCIPRLNEHNLEYKLSVLTRLENHGAIMLNSASSMELCNDKLKSQVLLNTAGIRTPWSIAVGSSDMLTPMIEQAEKASKLQFPMIVKTLRGTHGIGVMKVDSKASLLSVAQAFLAQNVNIMLQEFIEHDKSARIIMLGESMLAANLRMQPENKDEFRTNSHLGSSTQKYNPSEDELAVGRKIVDLFGCKFCAIDYILVNDEIIVLEVNGSPGLEAIQKDWEDERVLAKLVVEFCATLDPQAVVPTTAAIDAEMPQADVQTPDEPAPLIDIEPITILRLTNGNVDARVDTGAAYCSLHVDKLEDQGNSDWVRFTRGDIKYKVPLLRKVRIRNAHGVSERVLVELDVEIRGQRYNKIAFTITDRAKMNYEALIGRNLLQHIGLPVVVPSSDEPTSNDESQIEVEEE